jgi:hypothetical protein
VVTRTRNVKARRSYDLQDRVQVKTAQKEIENVFGLPQGCVRLCDPSGEKVRSNCTIKTLKSKYEE